MYLLYKNNELILTLSSLSHAIDYIEDDNDNAKYYVLFNGNEVYSKEN